MTATRQIVKHPLVIRSEHILAACRALKGTPGRAPISPAERWSFAWAQASPVRTRQVAAVIRQLAVRHDDAHAAVIADVLDADADDAERDPARKTPPAPVPVSR